MPHLADELRAQADAAMTAMREAALAAREVHARAELMRHMLLTANKMKDHERGAAIRKIVDEWLAAWTLDRSWPHVQTMEALAGACLDHVLRPSDTSDGVVRSAWADLGAAFSGAGLPVADQMAWRSSCAHGWWAQVRPAPAGKGRKDRAWPAQPFWDDGCPPHCLG